MNENWLKAITIIDHRDHKEILQKNTFNNKLMFKGPQEPD